MIRRSSAFLCALALFSGPTPSYAFEYFEHKYIGDLACEAIVAAQKLPSGVDCTLWQPAADILGFKGAELTFGDVVALSGDHYEARGPTCELCEVVHTLRKPAGEVGPTPLSGKLGAVIAIRDAQLLEVQRWFGSGERDVMRASDLAFLKMMLDRSSTGHAATIRSLMTTFAQSAQSSASGLEVLNHPFEADLATMFAVMQGFSKSVTEQAISKTPGLDAIRSAAKDVGAALSALRRRQERGRCFSGSEYLLEAFNSLPDYIALARYNSPHFGAKAFTRYRELHAAAIESFRAGNSSRALIEEGEALHFLTDLFAAGHIRTPRDDLPAAEAKARHDWDNKNGLVVRAYLKSKAPSDGYLGAYWVSHGDGCLFGTPADANRRMVLLAAASSILQVFGVGDEGEPFFRPTAVPLLTVNPLPPVAPTHHLTVGMGVGVISPVLDGYGRVVTPVALSGILGLSYSIPVKPWALDGRMVAVSGETRVSPIGLAAEWTLGDWGARLVIIEPVLRLTDFSHVGGIGADFRGDLSYLLYPPLELRFSLGFLLRGWAFGDDVRSGGGEPHFDALVAYRFSTF